MPTDAAAAELVYPLKAPATGGWVEVAPIAAIGVGPVVAVTHKDFPATTIQEIIAISKKKPVNVGNYAVGSGWQMMLNQLAKDTEARPNVVNYKGTGAMLADLFAGHIDLGAGSLAGLAGGLQKGLVKPSLIAVGTHSSELPGIPTLVDAGFKGPAYEDLAELNILMAPAGGTPQNIVDTLARLVPMRSEFIRRSPWCMRFVPANRQARCPGKALREPSTLTSGQLPVRTARSGQPAR